MRPADVFPLIDIHDIHPRAHNILQPRTQALQRSGEKFWRLPLDQEYLDQIRSSIADIVNSGGRYGGASTAAAFLREFVADTPWIHLDIAGTAWNDDAKPWLAKGPTGVALRTLVHLVLSL